MSQFRKIVVACIVAAIFSVGAANAQSFVVAPNSSFTLNLDSEDGNFSLWKAEDLSGLSALEARVTFVRKGSHRQWMPTLMVAIEGQTSTALFRVVSFRRRGELTVRTELIAQDSETVIQEFLFAPELGEEFDLRVEWTSEGAVVFTVHSRSAPLVDGFERHEVQLGQRPSSLRISNSTGEVNFAPLRLGNIIREDMG